MSPRELEQGVAWFADQFYSLPSIFERLLCKSRVGIWWNLPRNLGYRLALHWRAAVRFDDRSRTALARAPQGAAARAIDAP
jgi:hypothetical protein